MPGRVVGVGRRDERRPRRVGRSIRVALRRLPRPADRLKRPPEVEVVLVVPAVDRRVRAAQVHHREETRTVGGVEVVSCDEVSRDRAPAHDGVALPEDRVVRLGRRAVVEHLAVAAERLDLVELCRVGGARQGAGAGAAELRRALHEERLDAAHPRSRVLHHRPVRRHRVPVPDGRVRHPLRRPEASVAFPCGNHRVGGGVPCVDPLPLERVVRYRRERRRRIAWRTSAAGFPVRELRCSRAPSR